MNKIKVKCGIPHKHNYADCCAACTHGEYPAEGASGHVKTCKRYKPMTQLDTKQKIEEIVIFYHDKECDMGIHDDCWEIKEAVDQLYSLYQEAYTPKELLKIFHKSPYSSGHTLQFLKWLSILKKGNVT